jgi:toxin-antitoxin system PIN domain toxin
MALFLLDVNVLVALSWNNHQFHAAANRWILRHQNQTWATCTLTQLGFIRLSCNRSIFGSQATTPEQARLVLQKNTSSKTHRFLTEIPHPDKVLNFSQLLGHQQLTDSYLLQLARHHRARFVTFDSQLRALITEGDPIDILRA